MGATERQEKYAFIAARMLTDYGHEIVPFGNRKADIFGKKILNEFPDKEEIDTVTLYLNPTNQRDYIDKILALKPKRIIFNPGTENFEFEEKAKKQGIEVLEACTLVMLRSGQY